MTYYRINKNTPERLGGSSALRDASVEELRVLLCVYDGGAVAADALAALAKDAGCSLPRVRSALRYWCECGLLTEGDAPEESAAPAAQAPTAEKTAAQKKPLRPAEGATVESPATVAKTVKDENLAAFIDTAQQTVGRVFNLRELNILTALFDITPFTEEYLLTLISYCKTKTKRFSFAYLEKTAYSMLERECLSVAALNEYLSMLERVGTREWRLRRLFGFGERRLSAKERGYFERWLGTFDYTEEIVGIAYDITVNNTGKLSLAYMDKLLTRFYEAGCCDSAAVEELLAREASEKKTVSRHTGPAKKERDTTYRTDTDEKGSATSGSSFVASDFLAAALRRSYGDDGEDEK